MHRQGSRAIVSPCRSSSRQMTHSPASFVSTSSAGKEKVGSWSGRAERQKQGQTPPSQVVNTKPSKRGRPMTRGPRQALSWLLTANALGLLANQRSLPRQPVSQEKTHCRSIFPAVKQPKGSINTKSTIQQLQTGTCNLFLRSEDLSFKSSLESAQKYGRCRSSWFCLSLSLPPPPLFHTCHQMDRWNKANSTFKFMLKHVKRTHPPWERCQK